MQHHLDARAWIEHARAQAHPQLLLWYSPAQLEANLSGQLERDLDWLENLGERFARNIPVVGAAPAMYNHRVCDIAGMTVMLGIRFRGGDPGFPFVDVVRSSTAITSPDQVAAITQFVRADFAVFQPRAVRFYQPSHLGFQFDLANASGDKRWLAAPITTMLEHPRPGGLERVRVQRAHTLEFYERYASTYAAIYEERPWLPHESHTHSREDMQAYLKDAIVLEVFVDDRWAGITGGEHQGDGYGLSGFVVIEMLLARFARGQGLGAAVQFRLAEALEPHAQASDVLYGTIGSNNPPMLKTAGRVGRVDVGGWFWMMLEPA